MLVFCVFFTISPFLSSDSALLDELLPFRLLASTNVRGESRFDRRQGGDARTGRRANFGLGRARTTVLAEFESGESGEAFEIGLRPGVLGEFEETAG